MYSKKIFLICLLTFLLLVGSIIFIRKIYLWKYGDVQIGEYNNENDQNQDLKSFDIITSSDINQASTEISYVIVDHDDITEWSDDIPLNESDVILSTEANQPTLNDYQEPDIRATEQQLVHTGTNGTIEPNIDEAMQEPETFDSSISAEGIPQTDILTSQPNNNVQSGGYVLVNSDDDQEPDTRATDQQLVYTDTNGTIEPNIDEAMQEPETLDSSISAEGIPTSQSINDDIPLNESDVISSTEANQPTLNDDQEPDTRVTEQQLVYTGTNGTIETNIDEAMQEPETLDSSISAEGIPQTDILTSQHLDNKDEVNKQESELNRYDNTLVRSDEVIYEPEQESTESDIEILIPMNSYQKDTNNTKFIPTENHSEIGDTHPQSATVEDVSYFSKYNDYEFVKNPDLKENESSDDSDITIISESDNELENG